MWIEGDIAFALLRVAHEYYIEPLESIMKEKLLKLDPFKTDLYVVLELYFFTGKVANMKKVCDNALSILKCTLNTN